MSTPTARAADRSRSAPLKRRSSSTAQERVSRADVADALGMTPGGLINRVLAHARERGWIVSVRGSDGGIEAGDMKPPAAE